MYYNFIKYIELLYYAVKCNLESQNSTIQQNSYYYLLCKALLDHWELALYKYCIIIIIIIIIKNNNMLYIMLVLLNYYIDQYIQIMYLDSANMAAAFSKSCDWWSEL